MSIVSALYARAASARRRAWERPGRQRRLQRPVLSVGNLRVGGTGKTPVVACVAQLLAGMGERPAVLSRGYARRRPQDGVVVVSDGVHVRADLDRAGDEPLMLARMVPGTPVLVCADRYLAGRLAESRFGATVHLLDDGFQHVALARDTDLLLVTPEDVRDGRTLPAGRLRESLAAAAHADALLVPDGTEDEARELGARLGVTPVFTVSRRTGPARRLDAVRPWVLLDTGTPVLAVAGIARPERFFADVERAGHTVAGTLAYRDHHRFSAGDVAETVSAARRAGARAIMTTEKDLMRLLPFRPLAMPLAWLPLSAVVEPAPAFRDWLQSRLPGAAHTERVSAAWSSR
jgi:tetraacyldisaccharide 4'-kinase